MGMQNASEFAFNPDPWIEPVYEQPLRFLEAFYELALGFEACSVISILHLNLLNDTWSRPKYRFDDLMTQSIWQRQKRLC